MAYKDEEKIKLAVQICKQLSKGKAIRNILGKNKKKELPSKDAWYKWMQGTSDTDRKVAELYVQAKLINESKMFNKMLKISADDSRDMYAGKDGVMLPNNVAVSRDSLHTGNIKWALSKLNPKKYGNNIDVTSKGEAVVQNPIEIVIDSVNIANQMKL